MRRLFYLVAALQIAFLLIEAGSNQIALSRGRRVMLRVAPVDPRSLFMGNYMWLEYDNISWIKLDKAPHRGPDKDYVYGRTVYTVLRDEKPWSRMLWVQLSRPKLSGSDYYLRGRITGAGSRNLFVQYGIERYYIPESSETLINSLRWANGKPRQITVEVSVDDNGRALIRRIFVEGKPLKL